MSTDATNEGKTVDVEEKAVEDEDIVDSVESTSVASSVPNALFPLQGPSQQAQRQNILAPDGAPNDDANRSFRKLVDASNGAGLSYEGSPADEAKLLHHLSLTGTGELYMPGLVNVIKFLGVALDESIISGLETHALGYIFEKTHGMGFYLFHDLFTPDQAATGEAVTEMAAKLMKWFCSVEHTLKQQKKALLGAHMVSQPLAVQPARGGPTSLEISIENQNAVRDANMIAKSLGVNPASISEMLEPVLKNYLGDIVKLSGEQICKVFEDGNLHPHKCRSYWATWMWPPRISELFTPLKKF